MEFVTYANKNTRRFVVSAQVSLSLSLWRSFDAQLILNSAGRDGKKMFENIFITFYYYIRAL